MSNLGPRGIRANLSYQDPNFNGNIGVAVGPALTGCPPHRSGLEELPHPAPTSGGNAEALIAASRTRLRPVNKSFGLT